MAQLHHCLIHLAALRRHLQPRLPDSFQPVIIHRIIPFSAANTMQIICNCKLFAFIFQNRTPNSCRHTGTTGARLPEFAIFGHAGNPIRREEAHPQFFRRPTPHLDTTSVSCTHFRPRRRPPPTAPAILFTPIVRLPCGYPPA